jgi:hypothetical protein
MKTTEIELESTSVTIPLSVHPFADFQYDFTQAAVVDNVTSKSCKSSLNEAHGENSRVLYPLNGDDAQQQDRRASMGAHIPRPTLRDVNALSSPVLPRSRAALPPINLKHNRGPSVVSPPPHRDIPNRAVSVSGEASDVISTKATTTAQLTGSPSRHNPDTIRRYHDKVNSTCFGMIGSGKQLMVSELKNGQQTASTPLPSSPPSVLELHSPQLNRDKSALMKEIRLLQVELKSLEGLSPTACKAVVWHGQRGAEVVISAIALSASHEATAYYLQANPAVPNPNCCDESPILIQCRRSELILRWPLDSALRPSWQKRSSG